jgi:type IV secretory pathway VirD2 relaxase
MPRQTLVIQEPNMGEASSERLNVRLAMARRGDARSGALGARLSKAIGGARIGNGFSVKGANFSPSSHASFGRSFSSDNRQRVVIKVSFSPHRAGSGKLAAHAAYLSRDGAAREDEQGQFYDASRDEVEGLSQDLSDWTHEDPRHFRIMIAPESASRMDDLKDYVRDVMGQMESDLGIKTEWVAVNHWNTDNPHAHVILRGRTGAGHELHIPRAYLSHGLRHQARDHATNELGERSMLDERMTLDREINAKGLGRLDHAIAAQLDDRGEVLLQDLGRGEDGNSIWADSLRSRAQELEARGLVKEVRRNVLAFKKGWKDQLSVSDQIDIAKARSTTLAYERGQHVVGEITDIQHRSSGNTVLILDTGAKAKTMINTKSAMADHLQKGSWIEIDEAGKISRLSYHSLDQQLGATAFTALDRELDRIGNGEDRVFTSHKRIDQALASRADDHVRAGLGSVDDDGVFAFHDGAKAALQQAEISGFAPDLRDQGRGSVTVSEHTVRDGWQIGQFEELHSGRVAVLERARGLAGQLVIAPAPLESALQIGDTVSLGGVARGGVVQMAQDLDFGLDLGR